MTLTISLLFLLIAVICFAISAFWAPEKPNLTQIGLAFFAASLGG